MQIQKLSDQDLLSTLQDSVALEREQLVLQLQIFIEMDRRKLYGGYSSLWVYLTEELGMEGSVAQRRVIAAR